MGIYKRGDFVYYCSLFEITKFEIKISLTVFLYLYILLNKMVEMLSIDKTYGVGN